jgi:hypothetical protein
VAETLIPDPKEAANVGVEWRNPDLLIVSLSAAHL